MKITNNATIAIFAIKRSQNSFLKNKESIVYITINITTKAIILPTFRLSITIHQQNHETILFERFGHIQDCIEHIAASSII